MALTLGIDLGTSKVAAAIADMDRRETLDAVCILHCAAVVGAADEAEQHPDRILEAIDTVIGGLKPEYREQIQAIGITGQMHGLVLWNPDTWEHSPLITWEDKRVARNGYLDELRISSGDSGIHTGFAGANLSWFAHNTPAHLEQYFCCGTIMDYVVAYIAELSGSYIDPSNAHSWGFFQLEERSWNMEQINKAAIPQRLLPEIRTSGSLAGQLSDELAKRWKLPAQTPVGVACGDNPAAIYASVKCPDTDLALNLGTGGQLAVILDSPPRVLAEYEQVEYRPFLDHRVIAVVSTECGGKAFSWLLDQVETWIHELDFPPIPRTRLAEQLIKLGLENYEQDPPEVLPTFSGDRQGEAQTTGTINNLTMSNMSLGQLSKGVALGAIKLLFSRMPTELIQDRVQVVATGNGVRRSELMRETIRTISGLPLVIPELLEEAATGAALLAGDQLLKTENA